MQPLFVPFFSQNKPIECDFVPFFSENKPLFSQNKPIECDSKPFFSENKPVKCRSVPPCFGTERVVEGLYGPLQIFVRTFLNLLEINLLGVETSKGSNLEKR